MEIPEFHLNIYIYAKKRGNNGELISYNQLKEVINRVVYRPASSFYIKTIKEMEKFGLLREITGNKHKSMKYKILKSKEIERRIEENKSAFPIKIT